MSARGCAALFHTGAQRLVLSEVRGPRRQFSLLCALISHALVVRFPSKSQVRTTLQWKDTMRHPGFFFFLLTFPFFLASVASIGGAGTFDGIFLAGIFAVLLA